MEKYVVDVFIPAYKPGPELAELLRSLAKQVYPIHQVFIANTEKKYWDPAFEKAYPNIQGAYPMINQQFVLHEAQNYAYVNREDYAGD